MAPPLGGGSGGDGDGVSVESSWRLLCDGELHAAKLALEAVIQARPDDLQARVLLVDACLELGGEPGSLEEAAEVARRAYDSSIKTGSEQAACAVAAAVSLGSLARQPQLPQEVKQQHRLEAISLLRTVADEATAGRAYALVHYNLGVLLAETAQPDAAMAHARLALGAAASGGAAKASASVLPRGGDGGGDSGEGAGARQQLATLCLVLCSLLMTTRQQHAAALKLLSAAPAVEHSSADASGVEPLHLCEVLLARTQARLLADHASDAGGAMARLARLKKRCIAAVAGGERAHTQAELRAFVWQDLALMCAQAGDHANARVCVVEALRLTPWDARAHVAVGRVHEAAGAAAAALESYNTALALEPCHAPALLRLGTMYQRRGSQPDLALAHALLSDCLRYDASCAAAWYQLGLVCRGLGHREDAEQRLHVAVTLAAAAPALPLSDCPLLLRV